MKHHVSARLTWEHQFAFATGAIAFDDGTVLFGRGCGRAGMVAGELCFNTAMTGYQEILTDPSYARQVVMFTFPHIGNVGANGQDDEHVSQCAVSAAQGVLFRQLPVAASNWRAQQDFLPWLAARGIVGLSGIDTRAITHRIRMQGMPSCALVHAPAGQIDVGALVRAAGKAIATGDLTAGVSTRTAFLHDECLWSPTGRSRLRTSRLAGAHVVVVDFGVKKNILRHLAAIGARVSVVGARSDFAAIALLKPDAIVLSSGPGDPAATIGHAGAMVRQVIDSGLPVLGVCLGHQLLALARGGRTRKMTQGHHGANHPVRELKTGQVMIVSMNHGFTVNADTLPDGVEQSHISLFDGTNAGLYFSDRPVMSVQYHPEAGPGPSDGARLFDRFAELVQAGRAV